MRALGGHTLCAGNRPGWAGPLSLPLPGRAMPRCTAPARTTRTQTAPPHPRGRRSCLLLQIQLLSEGQPCCPSSSREELRGWGRHATRNCWMVAHFSTVPLPGFLLPCLFFFLEPSTSTERTVIGRTLPWHKELWIWGQGGHRVGWDGVSAPPRALQGCSTVQEGLPGEAQVRQMGCFKWLSMWQRLAPFWVGQVLTWLQWLTKPKGWLALPPSQGETRQSWAPGCTEVMDECLFVAGPLAKPHGQMAVLGQTWDTRKIPGWCLSCEGQKGWNQSAGRTEIFKSVSYFKKVTLSWSSLSCSS